MAASNPVTTNQIETPEQLQTKLQNLVVAYAVAFTVNSVSILEKLAAAGPVDAARLMEALSEDHLAHPELLLPFRSGFAPALRDELNALFGAHAGDLLYRVLADPAEAGDLVALSALLPSAARQLHMPLNHYTAARQLVQHRHARLIQALASQGLETVSLFYSEPLREAQASVSEALADLRQATRNASSRD